MKKSLFVLLFLLAVLRMYAQINITKSPTLTLPASISLTQCDEIIKALNEKLENYKKTATLFNKKNNRIDRESVEDFKKNFSLDAKVLNDLYEYREEYLQDLDGYINIVRLYFPNAGIRFGISNPVLESIEETDSRYSVVIKLEKQTERFYNANGEVLDGVRIQKLAFVYDIRKGELNSSKITLIRYGGPDIDPPSPYFNYYGLELSAGIANWSFNNKLPETATNSKAGGKIKNLNGKAWSVGGTFRSNFFAKEKSPSKNLFLIGGVRLSSSDFKVELSSYSVAPLYRSEALNSKGEKTDSLYRLGHDIQVTEQYSSMGLSVPVGLSYRILNKPKSALMLDVCYVPTFDFIANTTVKGEGVYEIKQGNNNFTSLLQPDALDAFINDNALDKRNIDYSTKPTKQLSNSVGLSLMYYKDLQDDLSCLGIAIGLDVLWGLTAKIKDITIDSDKFEYINDNNKDVKWDGSDPFRSPNLGSIYPVRNDGGLIGTYLQKNLLRQIGLKVILYYKQGRKP